MRWKRYSERSRRRHQRWYDRVSNWHPYFTWRRINVGEHRVWLQWVDRRIYYFGGWYVTEYRERH